MPTNLAIPALSHNSKQTTADNINLFCAIQVGASTLQKLNQHRRTQLRPHVHPRYRELCNRPEKEDLELLGPDLEERLSTMNRAKTLNNYENNFLGKRPQNSWGRTNQSRKYGNSSGQANSYSQPKNSNNHRGGKARPFQENQRRHQPYYKGGRNDRGRRN